MREPFTIEPGPKAARLQQLAQEMADILLSCNGHATTGQVYRWAIDTIERPLLAGAMTQDNNNQVKVAHRLGVNRSTLRTRLRRHGICDAVDT